MQYCKKCKMSISGNKVCCPLCHGDIEGEPSEAVFPKIKKPRFSEALSFKIVSFICIVLIIIFSTTYFLSESHAQWLIYTICGLFFLWINISMGILYRNSVIKNITIQFYLFMLIIILFDIYTGFEKWSIQWVLPCYFVALIICTFITGWVLKLPFEDFILYLIFDSILGMGQIIFVIFHINKFIYPSIICISFLLICDFAIFIFKLKDVRKAVIKLFHI